MTAAVERMKSPLKWAGGKFRLLDRLIVALPPGRRLVEPFVGSGAVFMNTDYRSFLLCDLNRDLIGFFSALTDEGGGFIDFCRLFFAAGTNQPAYFNRARLRFNDATDKRERAALFLYLNRHAYNGLMRYNSKGEYNVPFGRYANPYFPEREMLGFAAKAKRAKTLFRVADFRETFTSVKSGDVVYCDPPYAPLSPTANFTGYTGGGFGEAEQQDLADCAVEARRRGVTVVISNHDTPDTRRYYRGADALESFTVRRFISCNGGARDKAPELLALYRP